MKHLIITAMITILATINLQAETEVEMCKAFIERAHTFQESMNRSYQNKAEQDDLARATMAFYKDEVVGHCGNIASKMPYDKNYFANQLAKQENASVYHCKVSIDIAKSYAANENKSPIIENAHKVNVIDNCGTLMAKKSPAFCFFEVVDKTSKDEMKKNCLASVEKAHKFQETNNKDIELVQQHKDEIRANCGGLMSKS